jgi:hypothetical protein
VRQQNDVFALVGFAEGFTRNASKDTDLLGYFRKRLVDEETIDSKQRTPWLV